ncbi:lysophospholipid acyltransferase family protein [Desulfothermus okinawensis JCM 13304]
MKIDFIKTAPVLSFVLKFWYKTLRYSQVGIEQVIGFRCREKGRVVLFTLWHDELFAPIYVHRHEDVVILVSESRDGEFVSRILNRFGYATIRGSSTRGGVKALKKLTKMVNNHPKDIAVTIDGPTGPRHIPKQGVIYLAWKLNIPIVPVRSFVNFKKIFYKSWDRFQLPLPFATCKIVYGSPYRISHKKLSSEILKKESYLLKLKMDQLKPK